MNKAELAQKVADKTGLTKAQAEGVLEAFMEVATAEMKAGGEVVLTGFGTFSARARKGREGINPRKPEEKIWRTELNTLPTQKATIWVLTFCLLKQTSVVILHVRKVSTSYCAFL